jgi:D-glycero-D-manno-heptose 1,7-bisphosphate phosphatase
MNKAVFFDRDGVINQLVFNPKTDEYESPHYPKDFELIPGSIDIIKEIYNQGYYIFVISNQPSFAKGKTTLENIKEIQEILKEKMEDCGIAIKEYYYCYHHPNGIVPEYSGICECRKPKPFFIQKAIQDYDLDITNSWIVGDQDSDIECGKNAKIKTILVQNEHSAKKRGLSSPDYKVNVLSEIINLILK